MNKHILSLFLLFSLGAHAYVPTIESLLRNGGNQDIGKNTAVGVLNIERMITAEETELDNRPLKNAVKILFGNEDFPHQSFIQLEYKDGIVSNSTMNNILYKRNVSLEKLHLKNTNNIEASIFYALLSSLLTNRSKMFMELFSILDPSIKSNADLVNREQQSLLMKYKYYLTKLATASDDEKVNLINPLKPEDEEIRLKIKEILRSTYLINDGLVKRVRVKNKFYWDLVSPFIYARFDGENHKLKKMVITTEHGKIEIDCYNYLLFNGKLEFPEIIYFKDLSGQMYEIRMFKMYSIKDQVGAFLKRLKNYEKILSNNPEKNSKIIKPIFLL